MFYYFSQSRVSYYAFLSPVFQMISFFSNTPTNLEQAQKQVGCDQMWVHDRDLSLENSAVGFKRLMKKLI